MVLKKQLVCDLAFLAYLKLPAIHKEIIDQCLEVRIPLI